MFYAMDSKQAVNTPVSDAETAKTEGTKSPHREVVFSGMQPSGGFHIGNYLGAVRDWVTLQDQHRCFYCVVDLHAITQAYDPQAMRARVMDMAVELLACGIDPNRATLFVQSQVPEHAELAWVLSTVAPYGELSRMTQFKEKGERADYINCGLFTYPVLMAADILLYKATRVPVGEDQIQHLELTREIVRRFNGRFGDPAVFAEPLPLHRSPLRIMGLDGKQKMSKSLGNYVAISDEPDVIRKKISGAFTDELRLRKKDPGHPESCYVCGLEPFFMSAEKVAEFHDGCRSAKIGCIDSKRALAEAIIAHLQPIQERKRELLAKPGLVEEILRDGAAVARKVAAQTMVEVRERLGFLPLPT
jgi:tryptophanyl-tRNA synthetase